ncbi:hypothetical protein Rhopal_002041-T1 [Rhodotorula paludigena]|uniref:Proteophosphoglycan ppg4 n=1 Tax=Rhodotorula paludigena TaxID=86838 RepID=A0AAV5GIA3_9BASI|nr:hypothetical protein Rhopal_002041-T1 [Rhodotorula paludigena]
MTEQASRAHKQPAQAAPASSVLSASTDIPLASLAGIPPELKREVVEALLSAVVPRGASVLGGNAEGESDEHAFDKDMDVGFFEKRDRLHRAYLSLVERSLPTLKRLKPIISKHTNHVTSLAFDIPASVHEVTALRHRGGQRHRDIDGLSEADRLVAERANLVANLLRACPAVVHLDCHILRAVGPTDGPISSTAPKTCRNKSDGTRQCKLETLIVHYQELSPASLAFLAPSTSLVSLLVQLDNVPQSQLPDVLLLLPALTALPSLRHLAIEGERWMTDEFLSAPPKISLVSLELADTDVLKVSFVAFHTFLTAYTDTLQALNLVLVNAELSPLPVNPQLDFHFPCLIELSLATSFEESFYLRFNTTPSPVERLRIGGCYTIEPGLGPILACIDAHKTTLRRVHIADFADAFSYSNWLTIDDVNKLEEYCGQFGIRLTGTDYDGDEVDFFCQYCDGEGCEECDYGEDDAELYG